MAPTLEEMKQYIDQNRIDLEQAKKDIAYAKSIADKVKDINPSDIPSKKECMEKHNRLDRKIHSSCTSLENLSKRLDKVELLLPKIDKMNEFLSQLVDRFMKMEEKELGITEKKVEGGISLKLQKAGWVTAGIALVSVVVKEYGPYIVEFAKWLF